MTTDERLDALVVTVENIAGIVKDMLERQDAANERAEADREAMREVVAGLSANLVRLAEGARERFEQLEERADHDRRAMREIVGGLKDMIYTAHDRADGARLRNDGRQF